MKKQNVSGYNEELSSDYQTVTREENKIYEKLMQLLVKGYFIAVLVLFLAEVIVFFALAKSGELSQSPLLYFIKRVFAPSGINLGVTMFTNSVLKREDVNIDYKKLLVAFNFFIFCEIIVIFHSYFTSVVAVLLLPVVISVFFKKVDDLKKISVCCALGSIVHIVIRAREYGGDSITYHFLNYLVILAIYIVLYLFCKKIIEIEQEKNKAVAREFENQKKLNFEMFHDELTSLYNYRGIKNELEARITEFKEKKISSLILAMIDIDSFGDINAKFGNDTGDDILKVFASLLNKETNNEVYVARYEGEKFMILYANKNIGDVVDSLKRVKRYVYDYKYPQLTDGTITFGTGVVHYESNMTDDDAIMLCVKALKEAKYNGKNQTIVVK